MEGKDLGKTSIGIQANVAGLLCYLFGWVSGLVFFLIEKENKFVRFHALQSIVVFGAIFAANLVLWIIPVVGALLLLLINIAGVILWIILMIKAFQGETFKENVEKVNKRKPIAEGFGKTVVQLVLRAMIQHPAITCPIVGIKRPAQIEDAVGAMGWRLSQRDLYAVRDALA